MKRKRNHLAAALIAALTAAAVFEVYYFGFELPGEEARTRQQAEELRGKRQPGNVVAQPINTTNLSESK